MTPPSQNFLRTRERRTLFMLNRSTSDRIMKKRKQTNKKKETILKYEIIFLKRRNSQNSYRNKHNTYFIKNFNKNNIYIPAFHY